MKYTIEEATIKGHEMYVYEESEQSDKDNNSFDNLWQSIYDVCQVASYGIIDTIEPDELEEAIQWLKDTQELTEVYKETEIYFQEEL